MTLKEKLLKKKSEKVPAGWLTIEEMAKKEGSLSKEGFRPILKAALAAKLVEKREFLVQWGGAIRRRPYYRYIK